MSEKDRFERYRDMVLGGCHIACYVTDEGIQINSSRHDLVRGVASCICFSHCRALFTTQGAQFKIYFASVRKELFRIIWPSKQETLSTGMVVVVAMVVMTIIILLLDWLSTGFISYLIGS